tara:strand:+ start:980 stop:1366 length:387 start_codon:yes stop_codon:yes gene_type:complete
MKSSLFTLTLGLIAITFTPSASAQEQIAMVDTNRFQPIKAEVVNSEPSNFTINVRNFANMGVDQKADIFTVYTASSKPEQCADFRDVELPYTKPEKYLRQFDLSNQPDIMKAIEDTQCVAIKNIPPSQ